ncbi:MAG TPA: hypothetical protein VND62_02430 [Acidimicrobiales bacterium]|nr:hypothetical protein [Acidimicrobiales bacterium]
MTSALGVGLLVLSSLLAACGGTVPGQATGAATSTAPPSATSAPPPTGTAAGSTSTTTTAPPGLAPPAQLVPFPTAPATAGAGAWAPAGRRVDGLPAVYETALVPPGGTQPAGIAWMDTRLLSARLYSGSLSPGGGPYPYTAPIQPAQSTSLVAAFNGGFKMATAGGGYYTTGRAVVPLVAGAASLVIDVNGSVTVGTWGQTVTMSADVASVRQNLVPLVAGASPTAQASSPDWLSWGNTCGATSCTGPGIEHQWRSGVGVTADGALAYTCGPALSPLQLADLLVRAGVVRGMQLDINPYWTVFATYDPATPAAPAAPADGSRLVSSTVQGPATFFDPSWARDFITMSARPVGG